MQAGYASRPESDAAQRRLNGAHTWSTTRADGNTIAEHSHKGLKNQVQRSLHWAHAPQTIEAGAAAVRISGNATQFRAVSLTEASRGPGAMQSPAVASHTIETQQSIRSAGPFSLLDRYVEVRGCNISNRARLRFYNTLSATRIALTGENDMGRGIILWMLGVPIPIILLLALCSHS